MIRVLHPQVSTMTIAGLHPDTKKRQLEAPAKQYAEWLQDQVANLYSKGSVAAGKLAPNSAAYNKWKAANGFETTRGHLTGNTQSVLDNKVLYEISIRGKLGNWKVIITLKRKKLYDEVGNKTKGRSYIEFYEENKVPNETITALKDGWKHNGRSFFKHLEG